MARVRFADGTVINFNGTPTPQDIEEAYASVKGSAMPSTRESAFQPFGDIRLVPFGPPLRDIPETLAGFANAALGGFPKAIYEAQPPAAGSPSAARLANLGYEPPAVPDVRQYPEPQSLSGKLLATSGYAVPFSVALRGLGLATRAIPSVARFAAYHPAIERAVQGGVAGLLADVPNLQEAPGRAAGFAAGDVILPPAIARIAKAFRRVPRGLVLTEEQVSQMPPHLRARYFEVQRMREEARLGRQIGHFEERARLREAEFQARAEVGKRAVTEQRTFGIVQAEAQRDATLSRLSAQEQSHIATLDTQREGLEALLHETAKQKTVVARQPFFDTAISHSEEYRRLIRQGLENPAAQRARFTVKELDDLVTNTFADDLQSERLARNTLSLLDDPLRAQYPFSPQEVLAEIDALALQRGSYNKLRVYTNRERVADKLRSALLDLAETKGADFQTAKEYWRPWAQTRDRAIRLLRPFDDERFPSYTGARALEQVARGMGPQEVVREIERELGVNLTDDLRNIVGQLQANDRAKLLAKVSIEAQREEAGLLAARSISDYAALASRQTERIESVLSRKLATSQSELQAQRTMAEAASSRTLTRIERLQRQAVLQATRQERSRRILKRALFGLAAYGGAKQVPVLKDILP